MSGPSTQRATGRLRFLAVFALTMRRVPEPGKITATVDVLVADPARRDDPDAPLKVRAVVWSGPDFKTPTIARGAIFEDRDTAMSVAARAADAFQLVGIPVEGFVSDAVDALLPEKREGLEYDRL